MKNFKKNETLLDAEKAKRKLKVVPLLLIYTLIFIISQFVTVVHTFGNYIYYIPAFFELLMVLIFCCFIEGRSIRSIGFSRQGWAKKYVTGLVIGFLLITAAVLIAVLIGNAGLTFNQNLSVPGLLIYLIIFIVQGMSEEVAVRGGLMVSLSNRISPAAAVPLSALMFLLRHSFNPGMAPIPILNIALYGIFSALWLMYFDSIWGIGALHSAWNFTQGHIYGSEISGAATTVSIFKMESPQEKALINGGSFGPEGGMVVTVFMLVGILLLLLALRRRDA